MARAPLTALLLILLFAPVAPAHNGETPPPPVGGPRRGAGAGPRGLGRPGSAPELPGGGPTATGFASGWSEWWTRCADGILDLTNKRVARVARAYTETSPHFFGKGGEGNVRGRFDEDHRATIIEALIAAVDDPDDNISNSAIVALGKARSIEAVPVLLGKLRPRGAGRPAIRVSAVLALGLTGATDPVARDYLRTTLMDRDKLWRERAYAAVALGLAGDEAAVPDLWRRARDKSERLDVRACSLMGLGLLGDQIILPDLAVLVSGPPPLREPDGYLRATAAAALQKLGSRAAIPALTRALSDDHRDVRRQAVLSLGALARPTDTEVVKALVRFLASERDKPAMGYTAAALGEIGAPAAARPLLDAYLKEQKAVSTFAALGLGLLIRRSGDPVLRERLLPILRSDLVDENDGERRAALAIALGIAGDQGSVAILRSMFRNESLSSQRRAAATALAYIGAEEAIPDLRKVLEPRGDHVLHNTVSKALGLLGDRTAGEILSGFLAKGKSQHVRATAALSLGHLLPPERAGGLIATLADRREATPVRNLAAVALGIILEWDNDVRISRFSDHLNPLLPIPAFAEIGSFY